MADIVQAYRSTDLNSPRLSAEVDSANILFRKVLVSGYGESAIAITSTTKSGTTATVTMAAADIKKLKVGTIVTHSGATGADAAIYNIAAAVATIASTTTYTYTMLSTPASNATGTLLASTKLNATSITRSGTTATMILTNANTTLITGEYIKVEGWNETDYNVAQAQITVNSSTSVSYQVANSPTSPGTGTATYFKAGLGWTEPFTPGTGIAAFQNRAVTGYPNFYFRCSDNALTAGGAAECAILGLETMSDVNTGTGKFPTTAQVALSGTETVGGVCWRKSASAAQVAIPWVLDGGPVCFYATFNPEGGSSFGRWLLGFGGFASFKSGDAYNCFVAGVSTFNTGNISTSVNGFTSSGSNATLGNIGISGAYIARGQSQAGGSIACDHFTPNFQTAGGITGSAQGSLTYPNPVDGALWVTAHLIRDSIASYRGRLLGLYSHLHSTVPLADLDTATNIAGLSGVTLRMHSLASSSTAGSWFADQFGPWA